MLCELIFENGTSRNTAQNNSTKVNCLIICLGFINIKGFYSLLRRRVSISTTPFAPCVP